MPASDGLRADTLLHGLDDTQREAVTVAAAPLAILAGAGSGKTRVLTRRIAWQAAHGGIDARHVLALTFTRKAAGELVARLRRLGVEHRVTAGTFHAVALAQLRRRCDDRRRPMPGVLARKARLLAPMLPGRGAAAALAAAEVAGEIEWAKARLVAPETYEAAVADSRRDLPRSAGEIASLYARYEREKRSRGVVDFDDLIWWCADALESDREFADAQRWRFRHLFVDEFQDVNPAQLRLLRAWLDDRADLCVVGDADQAIYGFAGADPAYLTRFDHHFPAATVVRLGGNYRSTPQVVATAGAVLADSGAARPLPSTSRPDGPDPTVVCYPDEDAEAAGVARRLRRAHGSGRRWSEMAVLYRTNAQSAAFEQALTAEGVPFRVRGGTRFLDRPEVRAALDALVQTSRAAPGRPFRNHLADLAADADAQTAPERREHVAALARLGHDYVALEEPASIEGFVAYLQVALRGSDGDSVASGDHVELLTLHRAKGLEFDTVFVTGLERGLVPISHARTPAERAEERRLLYVGLSRAERALHLSWARRRTFGERTSERSPSPWLTVVEEAVGGRAAGEREGRARLEAAKAAARATASGRNDPDRHLVAALTEWRRNLARASGVPAYVIFDNRTLEAIARARPHTRRDLLALPGIGPVKAARHGAAVLDLVARHARADQGKG